ncbi:MAG: hypothetical protein LBE53_19295 [Paucimonas sp.]|jgi:hypothetical protein|nr:hypothetical protein [Paucimonas sp.]
MKIGDLEGSPQEIHDLFKNNGMDLSAFISAPMKKRWLVLPVVFTVLVLLVNSLGQVFYPGFNAKCLSVAIMVQLVCVIWLVVSVQLKFDSTATTVVLAISCLIIVAMTAGLMTLTDAINLVKTLKE